MQISRVDPDAAILLDFASVEVYVDDVLRVIKVSTLDERRTGSELDQGPRGVPHLVRRPDRGAGEHPSLVEIRRDERSKRQQNTADRVNGAWLQQEISRRCHHDGVEHVVVKLVPSYSLGYGLHDSCVA